MILNINRSGARTLNICTYKTRCSVPIYMDLNPVASQYAWSFYSFQKISDAAEICIADVNLIGEWIAIKEYHFAVA